MTKRKNIIQTEEFWAAIAKVAEANNWTMAHALFVAANNFYRLGQLRPGRGRPKFKPVEKNRRRARND
jgi:hypothetical protein